MKRTTIVLSSLYLAATSCGLAGLLGGSRGTSATSPSGRDVQLQVAVYAAVIQQLVHEASSGLTRAVYVIDGPVEAAGDPMATLNEQQPPVGFEPGVKQGLASALSDIRSLTFISHRSQVVAGRPPGHVADGGVLLTLGPIRGDGSTLTVGSSYWMNGLAGQWQTYVVQASGSDWTVTGTQGSSAIS